MHPALWWHETTETGLHLAFTSVRAGNLGTHVGDPDEALVNRRALECQLGIEPENLHFLDQVHSATVVNAAVQAPEVPTGDAWVSSGAQPLAIMTADCLPVLFAASDAQGAARTAAAHAGRPGLLAGVLENTVAALRAQAAETITAWIGPAACGSCYEIPPDMVAEVTHDRPALRSRTWWGTSALDLRAEARVILETAGVAVIDVEGCTIEDQTLYSHRRSQQAGEPQGRFAGLVWAA